MKKLSLLLFATTLVAVVSCDKSTSPTTPDPTPTPSTEKTIEFVLPTTAENLTYFEQQFEFVVNGTKVSFKESDMTEMTDKSDLARIPSILRIIDAAMEVAYGKGHKETAKFYKYTLGKLKKGETVSAVNRTPIIKSDRPSGEYFNCILGYDLLIEGKEDARLSVKGHNGVYNTDDAITSLFNLSKKDFLTLTYTCK